MPMLRRPHAHHRDVRTGLRAEVPASRRAPRDRDRYLMIEIALSTAPQRHPFLPFLRLPVTQRRRRSLDERDAHAEADARLWEGLQGMNVELAEGHKDVA